MSSTSEEPASRNIGAYPELDNLPDAPIARWHAPAPDGMGRRALPSSSWQREEADATRWRAALLGLTLPPRLPDPALRDLLLDALDDRHPAIVAEAIDGLWNQGCDDARERVLPLRDHPAPHVRAAILRYMSHLHPDDARPLLLAALRDPDPLVRENALDELDELGAGDVRNPFRL